MRSVAANDAMRQAGASFGLVSSCWESCYLACAFRLGSKINFVLEQHLLYTYTPDQILPM